MKRPHSIFGTKRTSASVPHPKKLDGTSSTILQSSDAELAQMQSLFFRLPFEIRILIYKQLLYNFGWGDAVHIVTQSQLTQASPHPWLEPATSASGDADEYKLAYVPCAAVLGDPFQISGSHYGHWPRGHLACGRIASWRTSSPADGPPKSTFGYRPKIFELDLLLSCKRMYAEASDTLYSSLSFNALGLMAANQFLTTISPRHLSCIRELHITWKTYTPIHCPSMPVTISQFDRREMLVNHRAEMWSQVCDLIAQMRSLSQLHISIYNSEYRPTPEDELLDSLFQIKEVEKEAFTVSLRAIKDNSLATENAFNRETEAPFIIKRSLMDMEHENIEIDVPLGYGNGGRRRGPLTLMLRIICFPCIFIDHVLTRYSGRG